MPEDPMRIEEITLVVPTRNEERNIGAFLASLPQALPIIVVDASHEDRIAEIVTAARRPACTLVRRPAHVSEAANWAPIWPPPRGCCSRTPMSSSRPGLMPSRWRGHDWGYWSTAPSRNSAARRSR
jgi:hypothetical protein